MNSLEKSEAEAAEVAKTPRRVTLDSMVSKIMHEEYFNTAHAGHVTICVMTVQNGFTLVGKSAPADPANFNFEFGQKLAREDCIRQLWAFEGYALREQLAAEGI